MNEWDQLLQKATAKTGKTCTQQDLLLLIGIRESGQAPKAIYSANEIYNLVQMAEQTVLVAARYYQLIWVEDNGWPHYQPLQPLPRMQEPEKALFLQPWIIQYATKNRLLA